MGKLRVLHVAQAAGGVDRYIRMLFKYMDHDKVENILVCSHDFKREDYNGLADAFEYVDMQRSIGKADVGAMRAVRKLIRKYQPDIVYAHSSKAGAIARAANIGLKKNGEKIRCIYNPHGWAFNMRCGKKKQMMYTAIEKMAAPFCDKIICISDAEKKSALEKKICKLDKLQVIVNGIDIEDYEQRQVAVLSTVSRESCDIPTTAFVVGMVGRISEQKAPDVFIKAAKQIKEKISEAYFVIVGDGPDRGKVENYAKENNIPLYITEWVENALDYVKLFDVALLLSRWEGFGLALPEYMLVGKPIVASNVDAIPSIITDGENGLLVIVDDVNGVVEAVGKIYEDKALRMRLINKGRITVHEKYDAKRVSREHEVVFASMTMEKGGVFGMKREYLSREECKEIQVGILKEIAEICLANGLVYNLAYGTLLGAIRHKGFIPWDDDIDITMPRDDYDKFVYILKQRKCSGWVTILDGENRGYYYPFAKVVDNRTCAKMEDNLTEHGIWIDVFPLDTVPEDEAKCWKFLKKCFYLRTMTIAMTTDFSAKNLGKKEVPKKVLNVIASIIGKDKVYRYYNQYIQKYKGKSSNYVACLSTPYVKKERMKKTIYTEQSDVKFENEMFKAPHNWNSVLKQLYGDYMQLPPEDKRRVHSITAWRV